MSEMKIYCMCLHDHHLNNLKKLNYIPVGLGKNFFSNEWIRDNTGENISTFFGSGIRFNIIPDYLEIYFPILSSNGWEIDRNEYSKKIRFVLTMNTKQFLGLFSRRWF